MYKIKEKRYKFLCITYGIDSDMPNRFHLGAGKNFSADTQRL